MGPEAVLSPGRLWFFLHTGQTGGDGVCGRVRRVGLILLLPASCMQYYDSGLVRRNACIRGPPPIDRSVKRESRLRRQIRPYCVIQIKDRKAGFHTD